MTATHPYSVKVTGVSPSTTREELEKYFSFCGKITSVDFDEKSEESSSKSATIFFEKAPAVNTALMLDGGTLDDARLTVTSEMDETDESQEQPQEELKEHPDEQQASAPRASLDQTDKPRAAIAAEYLAKGYTLSGQVLQRAIEIDNERGISRRCVEYFRSMDSTLGQRALGPDQTISGKVQSSVSGGITQAKSFNEQKGVTKKIGDYYARVLNTSVGQKVHAFYTTTSKQVHDIHEEARRLSSWHEKDVVEAPAEAESSTKEA